MRPIAFALALSLTLPAQTPALALTAPAEATETPSVRQALAFLDAVTTRDEAGFMAFVAEAASGANLSPDFWRGLRPNLTKLKFHAVTSATPATADLLVYDGAREGWARLLITVSPEPPYGIVEVGMRLGKRPDDVPPPPKLAPDDLARATAQRAEALAAADEFAGTVLIAHKGETVLQAAYGYSDIGRQTPNTIATPFRFGSMGKMFTAVAIMQLAEAGKLDLRAPVGRYLPDYPNPEVAEKVTVEHLLTHTGGVGDIFGPEFEAHRATLRDPRDYVAQFGPRAPEFEPGSRAQYSNYGFVLLGRIIEAVSGQSYDSYLDEHVFTPAHMTATGNQPESSRPPSRAVSYMRRGGVLRDAAETLPWRGTPAGGGYSTVGDLLAFAEALKAHRLLGADWYDRLANGGLQGPNGQLYRYDFSGATPEGRRFLGHGGGAPGMNGELRIFPDSGDVVVVLANRDPPIAQRLTNFVSDRLP